MFHAFPGIDTVQTMADVRARAEFLAWTTHETNLRAARHSLRLTRGDRAACLRAARDYKRRAVRVSQYINRFL